ncbi:MAG: Lrp/AsnC family transcriptional regulator [Sphingomonadaceae bacterium]
MEALDRTDRRIVAILQAEGRITNAALAGRVALSASACLARVKRLEAAGVIAGYGARLSPEKLGPALMLHAEVTLARHEPEDFRQVEALFRAEPRVLEASEISGRSDYLLSVWVADMAEWRALSAQWTAGPWGILRVTSQVVMHRTKPFAGYPVDR